MSKKCGIYSIISPNYKIYIGQSIDIDKRFKTYKNLRCSNQHKLKFSFKKYGVENHIFKIVELCEQNKLNDREIFYISKYKSTSKNGLNISIGGSSTMRGRRHSEKTKEKIRQKKLGSKLSDETKKKMSISRMKWHHSDKSKIKMSMNNHLRKKIIDVTTGYIYLGVCDAANSINMKQTTLIAMLTGQNKNKTNFKYYINE